MRTREEGERVSVREREAGRGGAKSWMDERWLVRGFFGCEALMGREGV